MNKPHWQTVFNVNPFISTRSSELSSKAKISESVVMVVDCSDAFIVSGERGGLFMLRVDTFIKTECTLGVMSPDRTSGCASFTHHAIHL